MPAVKEAFLNWSWSKVILDRQSLKLTNLAILAIEQETCDAVDIDEAIKDCF